MVEYLYNAIKTTSGSIATITAIITEDNGNFITSGCKFVLHDKDGEKMIKELEGTYDENTNEWTFIISAEITKELKGRFWYCIKHSGTNICFKQPIYFV